MLDRQEPQGRQEHPPPRPHRRHRRWPRASTPILQLRVDQITDSLKKKLPLNTLFIFSDGEKALFFEVFFYNPETRKGSILYVPPNLGERHREHQPGGRHRRPVPPVQSASPEAEDRGPSRASPSTASSTSERGGRKAGGPDGGSGRVHSQSRRSTLQGHRILLPSGSVSLDGDKARDFISYQDPLESDADMIGRRQKFLQALLKGLGENNTFLLQRGPFRMLRSLLRTNLPRRALGSFIAEMGRFDSERMVLQRVLGTTRSVDGRDLLFPHQDGELLKQAVKQAMAANASSEFVSPEALTITVEVLNGTRTAGLANRARDLLQSYDLEVMAPNNADNDQYINTVVLDRRATSTTRRRSADIIHCTRIYRSRIRRWTRRWT